MSQPNAGIDRLATKFRKGSPQFRILIIGRANAGKTTILKRICDTTEEPVIYGRDGRKIDQTILDPSAQRGYHDIENEMVFRSNRGFIFHDSRGFESGGTTELEQVKAFITERSTKTRIKDQLHAIWYCIPVDNDRMFTVAEETFFSQCGTGVVPVIVVFTKFDDRDTRAYTALKRALGRKDAKLQAPAQALKEFEEHNLRDIELYSQKYPPKSHVYLRDMNKANSTCNELIERTSVALDNVALQMLFVSTQHNSLKTCINYALASSDSCEGGLEQNIRYLARKILCWFPQFRLLPLSEWEEELWEELLWEHRLDQGSPLVMAPIKSSLSLLVSESSSVQVQKAQYQIGVAIIAEHSFYYWQKSPSSESDCVESATSHYVASTNCGAVKEAVDTLFKVNPHLKHKEMVEQLKAIALTHQLSPPIFT